MRTGAQETAPQMVMRDCSKEVGWGGERPLYVILVKREYMESSTYLTKGSLLVMRS